MAEVEGFYRFCVHCTTPVPEDRLRRGSTTCGNDCGRLDRVSRRRAQRDWRLAHLAKHSSKLRKALEPPVRIAHDGVTA
jgi:predicted nucleic acid-binding Zn ribbon protein